MSILAKLFLGPMLKVWIGVVLVGGAYFGVKAGLSWFESRVVEYEQAQIENASLRASNEFLETKLEMERAATAEVEKQLQQAHRSFEEHRNEEPTQEHKDWQSHPYPGAGRMRALYENCCGVPGGQDTRASDSD